MLEQAVDLLACRKLMAARRIAYLKPSASGIASTSQRAPATLARN